VAFFRVLDEKGIGDCADAVAFLLCRAILVLQWSEPGR